MAHKDNNWSTLWQIANLHADALNKVGNPGFNINHTINLKAQKRDPMVFIKIWYQLKLIPKTKK